MASTAQARERSVVRRETYTIHLISGSTGDLLFRLASMAKTQFSSIDFEVVPYPLVDAPEVLEKILLRIKGPRALVLHGLPDARSKEMVRSFCVRKRLPHFDLTGPLFDFLADCVGEFPDNNLSRLHQMDAVYQKRVAALEFALEHDDSLGMATLREAEIVIVGPSRVSKSPTTLYLSSRGYKVANVSISSETGFPAELAKIDKKRVIALTMQPKRLHEIRVERMKDAGALDTTYDRLTSVIHELVVYEAECHNRGYAVVDVTHLTIEETAAQILKALRLIR